MEYFTQQDNVTTMNFTMKLLKQKAINMGNEKLGWNVFQILLSLLLAFVGISGNILVALSILRYKQMRSLQNYFVFNLAMTDLISFIIILPLSLISKYTSWPFGEITCKYILPVSDVVTAVSILTLVAISIDRFNAVLYPMRKAFSLNSGKFIIISLWIFSYLTVGVPLVFTFEVIKRGKTNIKCLPVWKSTTIRLSYFIARFFFFYFLPTGIIYICYNKVNARLKQNLHFLTRSLSGLGKVKRLRQQKRVIRMFFAIFISFVLCYLPLNFMSILLFVTNINSWKYITELYELTVIFAFANSACNPVILYLLSRAYRESFQKSIPFLRKLNLSKLKWIKPEDDTCDSPSIKQSGKAEKTESMVLYSTKRCMTLISSPNHLNVNEITEQDNEETSNSNKNNKVSFNNEKSNENVKFL